MSVKICYNLKASIEHAKILTVEKLITELNEKRKDYENKPIYEWIDGSDYVKPYFDIDYKEEHTQEQEESILNEAIKWIKQSFGIEHNKELSISCSSSQKKISYHIVINTLKIQQQDIIKFKCNHTEEFDKLHIDKSPYGSTSQKFRMIYTSKENENRPLIPMNNIKDLQKHFITYTEGINKIHTIEDEQVEEKQVELKSVEVKSVEIKKKSEFYEQYRELLNIIPIHYADTYDEWYKIGASIISLDISHEEKTNLYNIFSKRSDNYESKTNCIDKLNDLMKKPLDKIDRTHIFVLAKKGDEKTANKIIHSILKKSQQNENVDEYTKMKTEFETNHFLLHKPTCVVRQEDEELIMFKVKDFKDIAKNKKLIDDKGSKASFFNMWLEDEKRREFAKLVFKPTGTIDSRTYNLFTGFKYNVKQETKSDVSFLMNTIKHILNDDEEAVKYVLDWVSHILQHPEIKTDQAIILYSDTHGVGKNSLVDLIKKVIGSKYTHKIENLEELTKNFNSQLENKLLVYGDEISARKHEIYNAMKDIITQKILNIERKGKDKYEVDDLANYIFTTNNYNTIKIEKKDRRFVMINCKEERMSEDMSNKFYTEIEDEQKIITLFHLLKERKIKKILDLYETEMKKDIQNIYMNSVEKFLYKNCSDLKESRIPSKELFESIKTFGKEHNQYDLFSVKEMMNKIKCILGDEGCTHYRSSTERGIYFTINIETILSTKNKDAYELYHN